MKQKFAHSRKNDIPEQTYEAHVSNVFWRAKQYAEDIRRYGTRDGELLLESEEAATEYHDLGKLDEENQNVLSGEKKSKSLPIKHWDAGAAFLLSDVNLSPLSAVAVMAHHIGLPDFVQESVRESSMFRNSEVKLHVDSSLQELVSLHKQLISVSSKATNEIPQGDMSVFLRLLLSCLVDADHTDTAINYGKYPQNETNIALQPALRLARLYEYVENLGNSDTERNRLRKEMYIACRDANISENIVSCDSPVGSGKTTAIMAHLLAQAEKRGLRRIFVVLPFTNIIKQSVDVYRKALVLPGENAENVVAELHHRADFESEDARHLTALWRAPIIVTTAVAFFETLAASSTSTLRRLHELPGSAIFMDEAHASLPVKLLPIAWRWLNIFADEWSCYWTLASGSLNRFWEIHEISETRRSVPEIIDDSLRASLGEFENKRITYRHELAPKKINEFSDWAMEFPGPRLVILNTVQNAAVIAAHFRDKYPDKCIEHLSTALTPKDRALSLERIARRLKLDSDNEWVLVATSCVEAGMDFSFRTGFREISSLTSLLQSAGRVNRSGFDAKAEMWSFCLAEDPMLKSNPGIKNAASVLRELFSRGIVIEPSLTTKAIEDEIKLYGVDSLHKKIVAKEKDKDFPFVDNNFQVIETITKIAVVDDCIAQKIRDGKVDWRELQNNSVQIAKYKLDELKTPKLLDEIYEWNLEYNSFLGYMAGIIELIKRETEPLIVSNDFQRDN